MIENNETWFQLYGSASWIWACLGAVLIWMEVLWIKFFGGGSRVVLWWNYFLIPYAAFVCGSYMAADHLGYGFLATNVGCGALWVGITAMKVFRVRQWYEFREVMEKLKKLKGE